MASSKFNSIQSDQFKVQFKIQSSPKAQKRYNELWKSLAFSETVPGHSQTEGRQAARIPQDYIDSGIHSDIVRCGVNLKEEKHM